MLSSRVELPSSGYQTFETGIFQVNVPDNWREIEQQNGLWFAPQGAYGTVNGQTIFTHAVNFGVVQTRAQSAQQATDEFVKSLKQGTKMRQNGRVESMPIDKRPGQIITFNNVNEATGRAELVNIITTQLRNGQLFYMITVSPTDEYQNYQNTFLTIVHSIRLKD
jgi:hypothetical protein